MSLCLSYIIPCYNVEQYIADCLDGIYTQNLPEEDYEVICVDDCSTDNTCLVVEKWQRKHANLHLIHHEENKHAGIARNTGVKTAKGDYICFVDADDLLPQNVMRSIVFLAWKDCLDVLLYNDVVVVNGVQRKEVIDFLDSDVLTGGAFVDKCLQGNIGRVGSPWAKLFRKDFLVQHSIWYTDLIMSEDPLFVWETIICAKRVKSIHYVGYIYRSNDDSMTSGGKMMKPLNLYTTSIRYPYALMALLDRYGESVPQVIREGIVNEMKTEIGGFFRKYLNYGEENRKEVFALIRQDSTLLWQLRCYMNWRQKIAYLSRKMGYGFFNLIVEKVL